MPERVQDLLDYSTFRSDGTIGLSLGRPIRGVRVVLEQVVRRWITAPGEYVGDLSMTVDLTQLVNSDLTPQQVRRIGPALETQAVRVFFVRRCVAQPSLTEDGQLRIAAMVTVANEGTYPLAVTLDRARTLVEFGAVR